MSNNLLEAMAPRENKFESILEKAKSQMNPYIDNFGQWPANLRKEWGEEYKEFRAYWENISNLARLRLEELNAS